MDIKEILAGVKDGSLSIAEAESFLASYPYEDLGFAKLDRQRRLRTGYGEVIFAAGKTDEQLKEIFMAASRQGEPLLATRVRPTSAAALLSVFPDLVWDELGRTLVLPANSKPYDQAEGSAAGKGAIAICTAGTSDLPVCQEALQTARFFGNRVECYQDIGIAGIHRLFSQLEAIRKAHVIIAIAGMEGALPSVLAGLVDVPVIAVPTSVGYGASFAGLAPLLTMLNSCAEGVAVVNIDNGFGAAYLASQINRLAVKANAGLPAAGQTRLGKSNKTTS